jgi:hypothetical protein
MEPTFSLPGSPTPTVAIINPDNPTPGTKDMTGYLLASAANASAQSTTVSDKGEEIEILRDGARMRVSLFDAQCGTVRNGQAGRWVDAAFA